MRADLAELVNDEARQQLQQLVQRTHPAEKLRYYSMLLMIKTLYGIHCGMLQSLFFRPTADAASIDEFVWNAVTAAAVSSETATTIVNVGADEDESAMVG
jgi:hypothetical protein